MALTHNRELRRDPTTGAWVALSEERILRPVGSAAAAPPRVPASSCPFCPGHEDHTPPTIAACNDGAGQWIARAFANKFPGVRVEGSADGWAEGPADGLAGVGAHEVIVETRDHDGPWHRQEGEALSAGLLLAQARLRDLQRDTRLCAALWFRNAGVAAGASQSHPHAQIVSLPVVPATSGELVRRFQAYYRDRGHDLMGAVVDSARSRRMLHGGPVVALCPYAPMSPYEVWLVPSQARPCFEDTDVATVRALSRALAGVLRAYDQHVGPMAYNVVLYTAPRGGERGFRWHVRVRPRVGQLAGFELATGGVMHHMFPERAAACLRGEG